MPSIVGYPYPDHSGKAADAGGAGLSEWEQLLETPLLNIPDRLRPDPKPTSPNHQQPLTAFAAP